MTKTCKMCGKPTEARCSKYCSGECFVANENEQGRKRASNFSIARRRAADLVARAFMRGDLVRQPCELCGKRDTVAHHDDYAKPFDVRWLCRSCHVRHHREFGPGKNAFKVAA